MNRRFHGAIQDRKSDEFHALWKQLERFAHHSNSNVEEFKECLVKLENTLFDLLAPRDCRKPDTNSKYFERS